MKTTELEKLRLTVGRLHKMLDRSLSKIEHIKEDIQNDQKLLAIHITNVCVYNDSPTEDYLRAKLEHISKQVNLEISYINTKLELRQKYEIILCV